MTEKPLLCVTVTAATTADLRHARDRVVGADLVELRLDTVRDPDVAGALADRRQPVVVTCRPEWEGGHFKGSEDERRRLLGQAIDRGAEYVDIEWRAGFDDFLARTRGKGIVLSSHEFASMPPDLTSRVRAMRATGAEVVKVAGKARRLSDCLRLRDEVDSDGGRPKTVLIAMGEAGQPTRILPAHFGSAWTYAGTLSGIGQLTASALLDAYRFRSVGPSTDVYGVTGSPVSHSVSPAMHNAAFAATHRDAVYLPLPAADVDDFVTFARGIGLKGASVTIPFKTALVDCVDRVDDEVRHMGALNTIRAAGGGWEGRNTDAAGFLRPLDDRGTKLDGLHASILGAGGSARAVAVALVSRGARVTVHARDRQRAERVAAVAGADVGVWPPRLGTWELLVNCTPIGMHPNVDETPVPVDSLGGALVYDLVYNPSQTRLLREAASTGAATIGGLDMLVAQAVEQSAWWTGTRPPAAVMRAAAVTQLAEFRTDEDHVV